MTWLASAPCNGHNYFVCRERCTLHHSLWAADTGGLVFKESGLLAIQDGGRRKPVDTFARETLIRITGRSSD